MAETATTDTKTTTRDRVYLKSGMGSVAAEDYDPQVHGKELVLTDEEYEARLRGVIPGITIPKGAPLTTPPVGTAAPGGVTTTIAGLRTFDPALQPAVTPAPAPAVAAIAPAPVGQPVATLTAEEHAAQVQRDETLKAQATADQAKADADRATSVAQHADDAAKQARQQADEAAKTGEARASTKK